MSRNAKRIMAGHICKIAAKTILRCGWTAIVMLCLGLYMLFPGTQTAQRLYTEKHTPFELIGSTDSITIDLNTLSQISGVERVSPILQINCQLTYGEKDANNPINAVYASYLNVHLTDGTLFTDNTNMPYLVLNEAATKLFSEKDDTHGIGVQEELLLKSGDVETTAQICGIYRDDSETPHIYMSYEVARKLFEPQFTGTNIAFLLTNKGKAEKVNATLQKQKFSVSINTDTSLAWNLLEQQTWQTFLVSAVFVVCSAILIREKIVSEKWQSNGEQEVLLTAGLTAHMVESVIFVRILMLEVTIICFFQLAAVVSRHFYIMAFLMELLYLLLHYHICFWGRTAKDSINYKI